MSALGIQTELEITEGMKLEKGFISQVVQVIVAQAV